MSEDTDMSEVVPLLSYYHCTSSRPLTNLTLPGLFRKTIAKLANKECLVFYDSRHARHSLTYGQLDDTSSRIASFLQKKALCASLTVAMLMHDGLDFAIVQLALHKLGCNVVMLRDIFVQHSDGLLKLLKCDGVIFHNRQRHRNILQIGSFDEYDEDKIVFRKFLHSDVSDSEPVRCHEININHIPNDNPVDCDSMYEGYIDTDSPAVVYFTSGSTGAPKAVQHSHHALVNSSIFCAERFKIDETSLMFNNKSMSYVLGGILGTFLMYQGVTLVSVECKKSDDTRRVTEVLARENGETRRVIEVLAREKCSHATLFGFLLYDILNYPELHQYDLTNLKHCHHGGQPLQSYIQDQLRKALPMGELYIGYGLSENTAVTFTKRVAEEMNVSDVTTTGKVMPHSEVKIVGQNRALVPFGEVGEICVRSYANFVGYIPGTTEDSRNSWLYTGDVGTLDTNGNLTIMGRKDDTIKVVDVKVLPSVVEGYLLKHPAVENVIVLGVPSKAIGTELCACVVPQAGNLCSAHSFQAWWDEEIQEARIPDTFPKIKHFVFVDTLPKTTTGKLDRKSLAEKIGVLFKETL